MRKPNYGFERRTRQLDKQAKKEAKAEAKRQKTKDDGPDVEESPPADDQETQ
ncbi:MAG: hypothetical protein RIM80_20345 [Alphaproteobacteria bacterium]